MGTGGTATHLKLGCEPGPVSQVQGVQQLQGIAQGFIDAVSSDSAHTLNRH